MTTTTTHYEQGADCQQATSQGKVKQTTSNRELLKLALGADDKAFGELLARAVEGDQDAFTALVEHFTPYLQRLAHLRVTKAKFGRVYDTQDLVQSVLFGFLKKLKEQKLKINEADDVRGLLWTMVRHKFIDRGVRQNKRRRQVQLNDLQIAAVDQAPSPLQVAMQREREQLLPLLPKLFTESEGHLWEARRNGLTWENIAANVGSTPDAVRMKFHRACERVARQLPDL